MSVRRDGSDRRIHATIPFGDEFVVSPGGDRVAFQEGDNVFWAPLPPGGAGGGPLALKKEGAPVPVTRLTTEGGLYPSWRTNDELEYGSGARFYVHDVATGTTDTSAIRLQVPRRIPEGTLALSNGADRDPERPGGDRQRNRARRRQPNHLRGRLRRLGCVPGAGHDRQDDRPRLRGHARAPLPGAPGADPQARLRVGGLLGLRRHDQLGQLDVVAERLRQRRVDPVRRGRRPSNLLHGRSVVPGRRRATERDQQLRSGGAEHQPLGVVGGDGVEAVLAAATRPAAVGVGHCAFEGTHGHLREQRHPVHARDDHGRADGVRAPHDVPADVQGLQRVPGTRGGGVFSHLRRGRDRPVERGVLPCGERGLAGRKATSVDALAASDSTHASSLDSARDRLQLSVHRAGDDGRDRGGRMGGRSAPTGKPTASRRTGRYGWWRLRRTR